MPVLCLEFIEFICSIKILIGLIKWNRFANLVKGHMSAFLLCPPPPRSRVTERVLLSQMSGWHQSHMDVITGQGTGSFGALDLKSWSQPRPETFPKVLLTLTCLFACLLSTSAAPPESEWDIKTSFEWFSGHTGKKSGRCGCC